MAVACQSQHDRNPINAVGGTCEGCEAIYEYGEKELHPIDTLPTFHETLPQLKISGRVFQLDQKTPAKDVILYIYHTNRHGRYQSLGKSKGWAQRHGDIRGWVKTGPDGRYEFYTFRPASYPNRSEPEHIHLTVKEPDKNEYYMDEYVFDDDPLLTSSQRARLSNRGGSGIVKPVIEKGILTVKRDLILGLNIPNYN
jgi:protocatechuate 3,4-dioxygenase beta subunit